MSTETVSARLHGFGAPATSATIVVERLGPGRRFSRAATALGLGVAAAAIALPIPIVHFVLVPGSLLVGFVLAAVRIRTRPGIALMLALSAIASLVFYYVYTNVLGALF